MFWTCKINQFFFDKFMVSFFSFAVYCWTFLLYGITFQSYLFLRYLYVRLKQGVLIDLADRFSIQRKKIKNLEDLKKWMPIRVEKIFFKVTAVLEWFFYFYLTHVDLKSKICTIFVCTFINNFEKDLRILAFFFFFWMFICKIQFWLGMY